MVVAAMVGGTFQFAVGPNEDSLHPTNRFAFFHDMPLLFQGFADKIFDRIFFYKNFVGQPL